MLAFRSYYFAQANYGCDAYGQGNYNQCESSGTSGGSSTPGGGTGVGTGGTSTGTSVAGGAGGVLSNTGYTVLVPMALALAILIAAAILAVKRLRRGRAQ